MPGTVGSEVRPLSSKRLGAIALTTFLVAFVVLEVIEPRWFGPLRALTPFAPAAAPGPGATGSSPPPQSPGPDIGGAATASVKPGAEGPGGKAPGVNRAIVSDTDGQGARLRVRPDSQADVVSVLDEGASVELTGQETEADGRVWVQIRAGGLSGWVAAELLTAEELTPVP
jgi:SH3 domain-containing protein